MTQKIIELRQAPVVLVELPEIVTGVKLRYDELISALFPEKHNPCLPSPDLLGFTGEEWWVLYSAPYGTILLGLLELLTEEQFAECVDDNGNGDYQNHVGIWGGFETAKQSFYSLLESEKVYTENPYGIERPPNTPIDSIPYTQNKGYVHFRNQHPNVPPSDSSLSYESFILKWQEAQQRTIDPSRTVVLIRKEE